MADNQREMLAAAIGKPQVLRLKQVGSGIMVGRVLGAGVLVRTVDPRTEMDRVEEEGLLHIPKQVKKDNSPLPTTGVVLMTGPDIPCLNCGDLKSAHLYEFRSCHTYVPTVAEGDMIMFPKFSGSDFNIEEDNLRILQAKEVLCTLVDTKQVLQETSGGE